MDSIITFGYKTHIKRLTLLPKATQHPQSHSVFTLPELICNILDHVDHPRTLGRCARVNRTWYDISIRRLWRGSDVSFSLWRTPAIEYLVKIAAEQPERFRYYLGFVTKLTLNHEDFHYRSRFDHSQCKPFLSSSSWSSFCGNFVTVELLSCLDADTLKHLLKPSVRGLNHPSSGYLHRLWLHSKDACALRFLEAHYRHQNEGIPVDWQQMEAIIKSHPLEYLELSQVPEVGENARILKTVLQKSTLLHAAVFLNRNNTEALFSEPVASTLRSLHIQMSSTYTKVADVFQHVPHLEVFHAFYPDADYDIDTEILRPATSCSQLRELRLVSSRRNSISNSKWTSKCLLEFAQKCKKIEHFKILDNMLYLADDDDDDDAYYDRFPEAFAEWQNLQTLDLPLEITYFGRNDFLLMAERCPKLRSIRMMGYLDFFCFRGQGAKFLALEKLEVESVFFDYEPAVCSDDLWTKAGYAHDELLTCMPRLFLADAISFYLNEEEQMLADPINIFDAEVHRLIDMRYPTSWKRNYSRQTSITEEIQDQVLSSISRHGSNDTLLT